jgi:hypothetical protein
MRTRCYLQVKFWSNLFLKGCVLRILYNIKKYYIQYYYKNDCVRFMYARHDLFHDFIYLLSY